MLVILFFSPKIQATCIIVISTSDTIYIAIDTRVYNINSIKNINYLTTTSKLIKFEKLIATYSGINEYENINIDSIIINSLQAYKTFEERTSNMTLNIFKALEVLSKNKNFTKLAFSIKDTISIMPIVAEIINGKSRIYRLECSLYKKITGEYEISYRKYTFPQSMTDKFLSFCVGGEKAIIEYIIENPSLPFYTDPVRVLKILMKIAIQNDCMCGYPIDICRLTSKSIDIQRYNEGD
ncbi:MAG: hypothetical protein C4539_14340 [Ignavibacteriales bacterium]|nr:MAG: hypothetical protein C4539_14340 [Ignavibacteriales bacterium]